MFEVRVKSKGEDKPDVMKCMLKECRIGKARDNLVQLRGWTVSGLHAEIQQTHEGLYVNHLCGDSSKTLVNGNPVESYGPLKEEDIISIGSYEISALSLDGDMTAMTSNISMIASMVDGVEGAEDNADKEDKEDLQRRVSKKEAKTDPDEERSERSERRQNRYIEWQNHVHEELLRRMDLRRIDIGRMSDEELRAQVQGMIVDIIGGFKSSLPSFIEEDRLALDVLNEAVGLGPLESLLADDTVTEVMVNAFDDIYVERNGKLTRSDVNYSSHAAVLSAIERIVSPLGRRIDESSPMVDARLRDGSRVNAIIPPLALKGPCITIRKFSKKKLQADDLVSFGALNKNMVRFLRVCVEQKKNIVISGGTGSGKTTLLNVLSNFIPHGERVITIEDAAELQLAQPHLVSLEARPANLEGKGAIHIRDLVRNCLRMRPDRIVVGECRGGEALDMLQAMNTGHEGSLTTAHANTPRDVLSRIEVMVMMAGMDLPIGAIREQMSAAVDVVVQQNRFNDGSRRVTSISELTGMESGVIQLQEIFRFTQKGYDSDGKVIGDYHATGRVPEFYEDMRARGLEADMSLFSD